MRAILPITYITFKEGIRHRILYGTLLVAVFMIFLAVILSSLFMRDTAKVMIDICLATINIGGLLVPFIVAVNLLARDIETRTIYSVLSQAISRGHYVIGRFLGIALITLIVMLILLSATIIAVLIAGQMFPAFFRNYSLAPTLVSTICSFLGIITLNSTVLLWCSITTSSFLATLLVLTTYVIGHSVQDLIRFMQVQAELVEISPIIQYTLQFVHYVFPNLAAFDFKQLAAHSINIPLNEVGFLLFYALSYISLMLVASTLIFHRRDFS